MPPVKYRNVRLSPFRSGQSPFPEAGDNRLVINIRILDLLGPNWPAARIDIETLDDVEARICSHHIPGYREVTKRYLDCSHRRPLDVSKQNHKR